MVLVSKPLLMVRIRTLTGGLNLILLEDSHLTFKRLIKMAAFIIFVQSPCQEISSEKTSSATMVY